MYLYGMYMYVMSMDETGGKAGKSKSSGGQRAAVRSERVPLGYIIWWDG
jgi:hypothetical protein